MSPRSPLKRQRSIVALSVSFEHDALLRRGLGFEHLSELVRRLARPIVLGGRSLAYAGGWKKTDDNFTRILLDVISAEQDDLVDESGQDPEIPRDISPLINHLAWPHYTEVDAATEAEWINSCRILRITQEQAGVAPCPDAEADIESDVAVLNAAVTLSAMRRFQVEGMTVQPVEDQRPEHIPGIAARLCLGGKESGSSGFVPGIFEEALLMLEAQRPLILLGGFGGATHSLAQAFLTPEHAAEILDPDRLLKDSKLARLASIVNPAALAMTRTTDLLCEHLRLLATSGVPLSSMFGTADQLSEEETRRMMSTSDMDEAVELSLRVINNLWRS